MTPERASIELMRTLKAAIPDAGLTQRTVAQRLGITPKHLCLVLNGKARPTLDLAVRIAAACGHRVQAAPVEQG